MSKLFDEIVGTLSDQRSIDWERIRLGRFTASEINKLMGKRTANKPFTDTAMTYIKSKIAEQLTGVSEQKHGAALEWGLDNEGEAIQVFQQRTGLKVDVAMFVPYGDHAGGSPDGYIGEYAIIEVKCPYNSANHVEFLLLGEGNELKDVKPEYYDQIQSNLLFTKRSQAYFISYDPRMPDPMNLAYRIVQRDDNRIEEIKERLSDAINTKTALIECLQPTI